MRMSVALAEIMQRVGMVETKTICKWNRGSVRILITTSLKIEQRDNITVQGVLLPYISLGLKF
jgi:hypothetical protein